MKLIEKNVGAKPSPGSMYPLLDNLKKEGLVTVKGVGRKKEYTLTPTGKKQLKIVDKKRTECLDNFIEGMKMLQALTGENLKFPMAMVNSMRRGELPFKEINPEWDNLRGFLFRMLQQGTLKSKAPRVRKILSSAFKELQAV